MNEDHRPVCGYCCGTNEDLRAELSDTAATALAIDSELVEALAELALLKNGQDGWAQYTEEAATNARLRAELAEYRAESNHTWTVIRAGRDDAEAAIVRVRELCESSHLYVREYGPSLIIDTPGVRKEDVLRALDGAE